MSSSAPNPRPASGCRPPKSTSTCHLFSEVLEEELQHIRHRRDQNQPSPKGEPVARGTLASDPLTRQAQEEIEERRVQGVALQMDLCGLALSGGGIRSATFALGVLQGLASRNLLKEFDYLSTVSGGGYIGSWLAVWIQREGKVQTVQQQLHPKRSEQAAGRIFAQNHPYSVEPEPVAHLRAYSSYLAPHRGIFSADSWVLVAVYVRNILLNFVVLLPVIVALLLVPRVMEVFFCGESQDPLTTLISTRGLASTLEQTTLVALVIGLFGILASAIVRRTPLRKRWTEKYSLLGGVRVFSAGILFPVFIFAVLVTWDLGWALPGCDKPPTRQPEAGSNTAGSPDSAASHWPSPPSPAGRSVPKSAVGIVNRKASREAVKQQSSAEAGTDDGQAPPRERSKVGPRGADAAPYAKVKPPAPEGGKLPAPGAGGRQPSPGSGADGQQPPWWEGAEHWSVVFWDYDAIKKWEHTAFGHDNPDLAGSVLFGYLCAVVVGIIFLSVKILALLGSAIVTARTPARRRRKRLSRLRDEGISLVATLAAGFAGGALLYFVYGVLLRNVYWTAYDVALVTTLGPPLAVAVILASIILAVGILGRVLEEDDREWWGSLGGWLLILACIWMGVVGLSLFGPVLIMAVPGYVRALLGTSWVGTALAAVLAGKSSRTSGRQTNQPMEWLVMVGPPIFLVGFLILVALLLDAIQGNVPPVLSAPHAPDALEDYFAARSATPLNRLLLAMLAAVLLAALAARRVDVNLFSLHGLYADRLVRCYLGASRRKARAGIDRLSGAPANNQTVEVRQPDPITGFDPEDDLPLAWLQSGYSPPPERGQPYVGPYPLINTTMNLVQGDELAWQERKGESFVLSPAYCGSRSTGYRRLDADDADGLKLGTAVALSGAAVSPNMGYHSAPAVTALLTLFNVRLGGWTTNPRSGPPGNYGPRWGLFYFLKELFGRTNSRSSYIYLSDGGHFENMGVYELVRRRCRCIVVCDGEQDAKYGFNGLGSAVRKCLSDLGIHITIDLKPLHPAGDDKLVARHWAIGTIHYDAVHPGAQPGTLVFLKASLTGDEPVDVLNYAREHPPFPHQTTADQFFTESQFESYRALGCHIADAYFNEKPKATKVVNGLC